MGEILITGTRTVKTCGYPPFLVRKKVFACTTNILML